MSATIELAGSVHEAETVWYDTRSWPQWVDQLARVLEVQGKWPEAGSAVIWESGPAGRGRVHERVVNYEPLSTQESEVEDDSVIGHQRVSFVPLGDAVEVQLGLQYRLKRRSPIGRVVDMLFIRRLMAASLARTLSQFRAAVLASRSSAVK